MGLEDTTTILGEARKLRFTTSYSLDYLSKGKEFPVATTSLALLQVGVTQERTNRVFVVNLG